MQCGWLLMALWQLLLLNTLAIAVASTPAVATKCQSLWKDCGSTDMKIHKVIISNCCDPNPPCVLDRGSATNITVVFSVKRTIRSMPVKLEGEIRMFIPIPLPPDKNNVCKLLKCPLYPHHIYKVTFPLTISREYPPISILLRWIFDDSTDKMIGCFEFIVEIK